MDRISFFIDGFNVYHSLIDGLKYVKYLWLDYYAFAERYAIKLKGAVTDVFYFSALAYWDQAKVYRHQIFIEALKSSGVKVVMGKFKEKDRFCSNCRQFITGREEKQTDVNIALYLLNEAYKNSYDKAMIMTNDTDLFKVVVAVVNIYTLSLYVLQGGSLKAPAYITEAPVWWSLLVHLLFLAFAIFVIAKDQNIRKVPSENVPILDF